MKNHFYSHIVETETISIALHEMDLAPEEKEHLLSLAHSSLHHIILDAVLSELSEEDKREFLHHVAHDKHDEVWALLKRKIDNIEEKIKHAADLVTKQLHEDIKTAKTQSK